MSIERVFFAKNAVSALKLGQARGALILSAAIHGLTVEEYSPSEVKSYVVGNGQADKFQVAKMVEFWIGKQNFVTSDASDGLALAICHAQILGSHSGKGIQSTLDSAKWSSEQAQSKRKGRSFAQSLGISAEDLGAARTWRRKDV
jgi:crossover junction endodeoxyribonuclease RuvC